MKYRLTLLALMVATVLGCSQEKPTELKVGNEPANQPLPQDTQAKSKPSDNVAPAPAIEFPTIPQILVPNVIGISKAQSLVESKIAPTLDPNLGIRLYPASCEGEQAFAHTGLMVSQNDETYQQVGQGTALTINADGSASGVADMVFTVEADGSGQIVGKGQTLQVNADGSGEWTDGTNVIRLDGKGGGQWTGTHGTIINNGDGSGQWNGKDGNVIINADGSGEWVGSAGVMSNDGQGMVEIAGRGKVPMPPLSPLPPAGKFMTLDKLQMPKNPCGFIIRLNDQVLFDFDKATLRPQSALILDNLATALKQLPEVKALNIGGHTDSKGSDDYNQTLSKQRADSVMQALTDRQISLPMLATGYGESAPIAPNELNGKDNPQGRQANRRVDIFVKL